METIEFSNCVRFFSWNGIAHAFDRRPNILYSSLQRAQAQFNQCKSINDHKYYNIYYACGQPHPTIEMVSFVCKHTCMCVPAWELE